MPRKKIPDTSDFPLHIVARSNNKEWFNLPPDDCWQIFASYLNQLADEKQLRIHAFVLMNNHYHLLASLYEEKKIGAAMCQLQTSVSRTINSMSDRTNHVFGGPYKASVIKSEISYCQVLKYVFRNPVTAGICEKVEEYRWSTLNQSKLSIKIKITPPDTGIDELVPNITSEYLEWLNESYPAKVYKLIKKGLARTEFTTISRNTRRTLNKI